jgi:hypothetical protein
MTLNRTLSMVFAGALCAFAQFPNFTPPTPLIGAALTNNTEAVKRLLDGGANPNDGRFFGGRSPIYFAVMNQNLAMADAMIAKGADINATDDAGSTPLMWAAYNETGDATLVNRLIALGADPKVVDKNGDTALLWALRRGHTPVVEALKKAGASDSAMLKKSVEKAMDLLLKSGPQFVRVSGCVSCHNNSLPQMAAAAAQTRGFAIDPALAKYNAEAAIAVAKPMVPVMREGKPGIPDPAISISYILVGLAADHYAPDENTAAAAHLVGLQQLPDGSFAAMSARPPIESSQFTATALSLRALQVYGEAENPAPKIQRAREWLATAKPKTTEDRAFQLLGLAWANADAVSIRRAALALIAEQRPDGGWSQLPAIESDAYATGQAMVALATAGALTSASPAWQRGTEFLLRTQLEDGSWLVRSRSFPFQPYKESGFPHGKNQWISAAGSSWAAWALILGQSPVKPADGAPRSTNAALE